MAASARLRRNVAAAAAEKASAAKASAWRGGSGVAAAKNISGAGAASAWPGAKTRRRRNLGGGEKCEMAISQRLKRHRGVAAQRKAGYRKGTASGGAKYQRLTKKIWRISGSCRKFIEAENGGNGVVKASM
jgi:hypothetical protein